MTDPTTTTTNWLHETFKQSSDTIFQQTGKINQGTLLFKVRQIPKTKKEKAKTCH